MSETENKEDREGRAFFDSERNRNTFIALMEQIGDVHKVLLAMGEDGKPVRSYPAFSASRLNYPEWKQAIKDARDEFYEQKAAESISNLQWHETSLLGKSTEVNSDGLLETTLKATEIAALKGAALKTRPAKKTVQEDAQGQESEDLTGVSGEALLQAIKLIQDAGKKDGE